MGEATRTAHVVTEDQGLRDAAASVIEGLAGWTAAFPPSPEALLAAVPEPQDVILLDHELSGNVYEQCRRLTGRTRCRTFVVTDPENDLAEPIAHFCGATGTLRRPLRPEDLVHALDSGPPRLLPHEQRGDAPSPPVLPQDLLRDLSGSVHTTLVEVLTDPETNLFNFAFLNYKLDEEFKRARRFNDPLSCLMLGFEGQASEEVLRELAGIFLGASRDTDILGRFDENSFLFLLPNTGPDGAVVMARRVVEMAERKKLSDLLGDPLAIAVGISFHPHPEVQRREDLFGRAREAFLAARRDGGGVVAGKTQRV